jgi:hypothetical protein
VSTLTQRLSLLRDTVGDRFRTQDYTDNWLALDDHPGTYVCTSTTRPTWGAAQSGMFIFETDTLRRFLWDGDSFDLIDPKGLLARAERLADLSTTATTYSNVVSTTAAVASARRHLVIAEAPGVYSTQGLTGISIWRDGTMLQEWVHQGWTGSTAEVQPRPLSFVTTDQSPGGSQVYSLRFRAVVGFGGTCTILGGPNKPISLTVVEV